MSDNMKKSAHFTNSNHSQPDVEWIKEHLEFSEMKSMQPPKWLRNATLANCRYELKSRKVYEQSSWKDKLSLQWRKADVALYLGVLYYLLFMWLVGLWAMTETGIENYTVITFFIIGFFAQNIIMALTSPLLIHARRAKIRKEKNEQI